MPGPDGRWWAREGSGGVEPLGYMYCSHLRLTWRVVHVPVHSQLPVNFQSIRGWNRSGGVTNDGGTYHKVDTDNLADMRFDNSRDCASHSDQLGKCSVCRSRWHGYFSCPYLPTCRANKLTLPDLQQHLTMFVCVTQHVSSSRSTRCERSANVLSSQKQQAVCVHIHARGHMR